MSGLNLDTMDLFNKKSKPVMKPIEVSEPKSSAKIPVSEKEVSDSSSAIPKFEKFTPVTARISEENYIELKRIESLIMRSRTRSPGKRRERITANSVLRCLVSSFVERIEDIDLSEIHNESVLSQRIDGLFKS